MPARVLAVRLIPRVDDGLRERLGLDPGVRSLGLITCDSDDVGYTALDEATKKAEVKVAYAQSMYAGAANANTRLAGEFLGILSGPAPDDVESGLDAARRVIEQEASFYSANDDDSVIYYAHCISRTGSYLSKCADVPEGTAMAYLIAPPLEAMVALDAAVKAADVTLSLFYGPPSETNFAGGLLTGDQAACKAACEAFAQTVCNVADAPIQ
jgi:ethanolamine utilization protein EutL